MVCEKDDLRSQSLCRPYSGLQARMLATSTRVLGLISVADTNTKLAGDGKDEKVLGIWMDPLWMLYRSMLMD